MERIDIIIAILTLLGGFFGIPEAIKLGYRQIQKFIIRNKAKKLEKQLEAGIDRKSFLDNRVFNELKRLLWRAKDVSKNKEFLQEQLEQIIGNLYDAGMYEGLQELRAKFQNDFEFSARSWANLAIANMNLYLFDGVNEYREYCLEACKESIKRLGNYGDPRAVMLIIYMIDYERKKQINKDNIRNMINEINSGEDTLVSYETYDYLLRTKEIKGWSKYIDHLFNLYPNEMGEMKNRYEEHMKKLSS
jgi:hypothetical protein